MIINLNFDELTEEKFDQLISELTYEKQDTAIANHLRCKFILEAVSIAMSKLNDHALNNMMDDEQFALGFKLSKTYKKPTYDCTADYKIKQYNEQIKELNNKKKLREQLLIAQRDVETILEETDPRTGEIIPIVKPTITSYGKTILKTEFQQFKLKDKKP